MDAFFYLFKLIIFRHNFHRLVDKTINKILEVCGNISAILIVVLIFLIISDISMRYILGISKVWMMELEWHLFSAAFLFAINYALATDKHIRVDIFYHTMSAKTKASINIFATLFLLIPWSLISFKSSWIYAYNSFLILETTPDPGGLPFRYIIKSLIPLIFLLLILQGFYILKSEVMSYIKKPSI